MTTLNTYYQRNGIHLNNNGIKKLRHTLKWNAIERGIEALALGGSQQG